MNNSKTVRIAHAKSSASDPQRLATKGGLTNEHDSGNNRPWQREVRLEEVVRRMYYSVEEEDSLFDSNRY